jgi:hypothetical protein
VKNAVAAFALLLLLIAPLTSEAVSLGAESLYIPSVGGCALIVCVDVPAGFAVDNNSSSGVKISQVVIDMTSATNAAAFGGSAGLQPNQGFSTTSAAAAATGFTGATFAGKLLTLNFTAFNPGAEFSFRIDIDNNSRTVSAEDFAGSLMKVTFDGTNTLSGIYAPIPLVGIARARVTAVPEPATLLLVGMSMLGIGCAYRQRLIQQSSL